MQLAEVGDVLARGQALVDATCVGQHAQRAAYRDRFARGIQAAHAHFAAIGHPLVGDRRYGRADGAPRLMLHAWRLAFAHPVHGGMLRLQAAPPPALTPPGR